VRIRGLSAASAASATKTQGIRMHPSTCISAEPSAPAGCRSSAFSEEEEDWIGLAFRSRAANSRWPLQEGVAPHAQVGDPCHSRGVHDQRFKEFWQAEDWSRVCNEPQRA
jgi:hypothetical protein